MYNVQSRIHRRWMGSHTLVLLTFLADLLGLGLTYLAGGFIIPLLIEMVIWLLQTGLMLFTHTTKAASQIDLPFYFCLGMGFLIAVLLGLGIGGAFADRYSTRTGNIGKGCLAFFCTILATFICWGIIAQFLYRSPFFWPPAITLPRALNHTSATIWFFYYTIVRIIFLLKTPQGPISIRGQSSYRYDLTPIVEATTPQKQALMIVPQPSLATPPIVQSSTPISRAHPGGPKWQHIESCYNLYRKALKRFDPPPFHLKSPDGFRYYDGGGQQIYWHKHTLLLPIAFLDYQWRYALLPELARQLMYYNAPDLRVFEILNSYPSNGCATISFLLTLNFIWLPTVFKNIAGERWQSERVLDADLYACKLGEAMRLRDRLRTEQATLKQEGLIDNAFPTLDERMEQINAFILEESRQLQNLGYTQKKPATQQLGKTTQIEPNTEER